MKNIKNKLENMKPEKLTEGEKNVLWSKIDGGIRARRTYSKKQQTFLGMSARLATVIVLTVFVLTSGSVATISAANAATPGDALFRLDLTLERLQISLARGDRKVELRLRFAGERLDEVKVVLATTDFNGTSTDDGTSTSTDDDTPISTDDGTSTPIDDTSTSTDDASTPTDDGTTPDPDDVNRTFNAFSIALELLEQTKNDLEAEGNDAAAAVVQGFIDELTDLAEDHVANLVEFEAKIRDNGEELKVKIKASSDDLKIKFKFKKDGEGDIEIELKQKRIGGDDKDKKDRDKKKDGKDDDDEDEDDDEDKDEDDDAMLTVVKIIINDNGGTSTLEDFTFFVGDQEVDSGEEEDFEPGEYVITESGPEGYEATFSGDCDLEGNITLEEKDNKTCTITNDDVEVDDSRAMLTVTKVVLNDDGATSTIEDFDLFIDEDGVESGVAEDLEPGDYDVSEGDHDGYEATFSGDCDSEGNVTLAEGDEKACTITNDDIASGE